MITPMTAGIALVITLIVFGPGKLPEIGRAIGKGVREFKNATEGIGTDEPKIEPPPPVTAKAEPGATPADATDPINKPVPAAPEEAKPVS